MECFDLGDGSCNACLFDEETGRCELYSLSGYFNKMLRIGETEVIMTSYKHWTFRYAEEDPGWNIVVRRVFADINFTSTFVNQCQASWTSFKSVNSKLKSNIHVAAFQRLN